MFRRAAYHGRAASNENYEVNVGFEEKQANSFPTLTSSVYTVSPRQVNEPIMAGPHEIALGIASVLGKPGLPNPMTISFRGQSLESAAEIVRAIIAECDDANIGIEKIELGPELRRQIVGARGYRTAVPLVPLDDLRGEMRVFAEGE